MVKHAVAQGGGACTVPLVHSVDEVVRAPLDADVVWLRISNHGEANVHAGVDQDAIGAIDIPPNGVFGGAGGVEAAGVDLVEVVLDDPVAEFTDGAHLAVGPLLEVQSRLSVDVLERESEELLRGRMRVVAVQHGIGCVRASRKLGLVGVGDFQVVYAPRNEGLELGDRNVGREREVGAHLGLGDGSGKSVGGLFKGDLDSGLARAGSPVQTILRTILGSLDALQNGPVAVFHDPHSSVVKVQEYVVRHVIDSDSFEAGGGGVVHSVVDGMQVLVASRAGNGLEGTVEQGGDHVPDFGTQDVDDLVYAVAGCRVDA